MIELPDASIKFIKPDLNDDSETSSSNSNSCDVNTASSERNYYEDIEGMLNFYEDAAKKEFVYLLERSYQLNNGNGMNNGPLSIKCGLSPTRTFGVAVSLTQMYNQMTFGRYEWHQLIDLLRERLVDFFEQPIVDQYPDEYEPVEFKCGDFALINQLVHEDTKFLHLSKLQVGFYLNEEDVRKILSLHAKLISHRILLLDHVDFNLYYNNLLDVIQEMVRDMELPELDILKMFCDGSNNSLLSLALREYIYFYKDNVWHDLNKI